MTKKVHEMKPHLLNALLPSFMMAFIRTVLIAIPFFILGAVLSLIDVISMTVWSVALWIILFVFIIAFLSVLVRLFILVNTRYQFSATGVVSEFKFVVIRRYSATYAMVSNVKTKISVWDRISGAGDIILVTADDDMHDIVLHAIPDPLRVEKHIRDRIAASRGGVDSPALV